MRRYQEMGGRDWSDPEHAVALVRHLGGIFDALGVAEHHVSEFRKAYNLAWIHCIAEDSSSPFTKDDNSCPIIISRGSVLEAIFPRSEEALDNESVIYVGIEPEALVSHILGTLRFPILRLTGTDQGGQAQLKELNQRLVERLQEAFGDLVQPMSEARIDVLVDEEPFRPGPADPLLIEANTEWLGELIRMGLELWGSSRGTLSARMLQSIDARLRKIRVRKANSIRLRMDKRDAPLPIFLGGVIEIKEDTPTIIVQTGGADYKRECLPGMARSIAHLIGQDGIGDALELALSKLGRITNDTSVNPLNDEDFAGVLSAPVDRVREIRRGYQGRLHALFELLCPVVAHFAGEEAAETFLPTSDPLPDEESVIEVLGEFATTLPMEPKLLVSCCLRTASLPDLRESLRIDYAAFNRTLAKLGPPYRPLHNEEGHRQAFAQFVAQRRPRILDALRKAFLADFDARRPLDGYVARRDLDRLDPDPDWLDICYLPSTDMMEARVNKWLTSTGAQSLGVGEVPLPPYDQIQEENRVLLAELHRRLKTIIPAWLKKFSEVSLPPAWCEGSEGRDQLYRDIEESGILDFRPLTDDDFIRLLIDRGHWPDGMEPTTDLRRLDLADEDLTSQDRQSERERERREFERNSIEIDGHRMSLDRNGARAIADAVVSGVSEEFLSSSSHFSNLTSTGGRGKRESSTKGGSGAQVSVRPTEQQKAAIGLSGEVAAYEWLNRNYRITPDSWKSRNRAKLYGGDPGNDSLGYDFEVRLKSITLMFEVKSSATDAMEIELGDSEVRCAQRYARRDEPYRILFILNVLDAAARRVYILPNPFGPKGRDCYHIVGSGLRYRFQIKD